MSGTSVDAVDAAMILTDGERVLEFGPVAERKYSAEERAAIMSATRAARDWNWQGRRPDEAFKEALVALGNAHEDAFRAIVDQCAPGQSPVLAGVHGQTLLHRKRHGRRTESGRPQITRVFRPCYRPCLSESSLRR